MAELFASYAVDVETAEDVAAGSSFSVWEGCSARANLLPQQTNVILVKSNRVELL